MFKKSILFFVLVSVTVQLKSQANCIDIRSFGVVPNSIIDCSDSLQKAINQVAVLGGSLCFPAGIYKISKCIKVPAGVGLRGSGMGTNATTTPYNGTLFWYSGDSIAFKIIGSNTSFSDLTIYNYGAGAIGGVEISASSKIIESTQMNRVQFYGFTSGKALSLKASNSGGIAYSSFYDIRIRHAKIGLEIVEVDANSFVNSNSFFHGVISGGAFQYAILIDGGNNNVFYSTVIEPPSSIGGHILVNKGQIIGQNIRIEANAQAPGVAVMKFTANASQSRISGMFAGGLVINEGNNIIEMPSSNTLGEQNSSANLFCNSAFNVLTQGEMPEYWTISNSNAKFALGLSEIVVGQKVLIVKVPPGQTAEIFPKVGFAPTLTAYGMYKYANFSALIKGTVAARVKLTYNYSGGLVSSTAYSGSGNWENVGLQALTSVSNAPNPKINLDNQTGVDTLLVEISSPVFCFGQNMPSRDVSSIGSNGGVFTGLVSTSVSNNYSFITGTNYLVLPKTANTFIVGGGVTITRLNHLTADRFPKGSIVMLLMNNSGINVSNSGYILLKSSFTSASAFSSLSLMSNGDGTWREVNRNN